MIEVQNLTKRFGSKVAVDNLSFIVKKGEVLGFLGPNGAGKSTTMRIITGYIPPTEGKVLIDSVDALGNPLLAKSKIGYLPENAPLYPDMTVTSFLQFCGAIRGLGGKKLSQAVAKSIETCHLESVRNQSVDTLSKGYKHRTCLAQAILNDPQILILDEPTDGLDPNQKAEARSLIRRMGEERAIIFSTHILEEVEAACTRAIIIDQGAIVADGTPEDLKAKAADAGQIRFRIRGTNGSEILSALKSMVSCENVIEHDSSEMMLSGVLTPKKGGNAGEQLFGVCRDRGWVLEEMATSEGRLETLFQTITKNEIRANHAA